jgi:hypothetical protein
MLRRTQAQLSPKKFVDEVAFSALDWPGKTLRLERDSLQDYCQRPASAQVSIAELYHENSKLYPAMVGELAAAYVDIDGIRREFIQRRAAALANGPQAELGAAPRAWLTGLAQVVPSELFYAIELRIAESGVLASHEPVSNRFILTKRFSDADSADWAGSLRLLEALGQPPASTLFLIGNFARNDLLFGARGYRRTLLEAGRVLEIALQVAGRLELFVRPCIEFADRALDLVLEADGVEEGVLAAIEIGDPHSNR